MNFSPLQRPASDDEHADLVPAREVARRVGRCLRTLTNWDKAGLLHPVWINGRRSYRRAEIEQLLSKGTGRV
jgi:predicted site-specific integrase-resolvase